ncbi:MAG TPA: arginine deiminase family protein [Cyclobacteriaceae bacterium]|jgi:N-dimethylarginine dimethylaminohydrolase
MKLQVRDEISPLRSVIVGSAFDFGGTPLYKEAYDPKSKENIRNGTFPTEEDLLEEIDGFAEKLKAMGVYVYRPQNVEGINQIFARDIGLVIEDFFIKANIVADRTKEIRGILHLLKKIDSRKVVQPPVKVRIEGGDVMPWYDKIFIGYSKYADFQKFIVSRTNEAGIEFVKQLFPDKEVIPFELNKSDNDARKNALHLDCCFQPIGKGFAIMYRDGFKNKREANYLVNFFGQPKMIFIDQQEMYDMCANIFSVNPNLIISSKNFVRLNKELRDRGFKVEEVKYNETAKMEGLLRCSTLPLRRS